MKALKQTNSSAKSSDELENIVIVYLPQYLEYLGFGLMVVGLVFVLKYKHER